jgi:hypothetical protein
MKAFIIGIFFLSINTLAMACEQDQISFPQNKVCVDMKWITGPSADAFNSASFHVSETKLHLNVLPWMVMSEGHEHGSRPVVMTNISPDDYLVEKMYFMKMMGSWFLKLQLINDQKEISEEVRVKVEL